MDITKMTALEIAAAIRNGDLTAMEAVESVARAYEEKDKALNAYISFDKENALLQAEQVQKRLIKGDALSPLAGVPIAVKDNICTKGIPTTCASRMLSHFVPPYDATVVSKIIAAGMVVLGKTNMDEFAMGSTSESSYFGAVKNPHDLTRAAGGSSGGAAAAVAGGEGVIALGSDTGGSIRLPCAYCGAVGLKPTYGAVSRYGLIAYASSLDVIGPIGKTTRDTAALYNIIKGRDEKDSTSQNSKDVIINTDLKGTKVGVISESCDAVKSGADILRTLGAEVEVFDMPVLKYANPAYYIIACAEASSNLARYDGIRYGRRAESCRDIDDIFINSRSEGFGFEVKKRIMLGNFVLSSGYYNEYYLKALKAKRLIAEAFSRAFKKYDFLLAPAAPDTAPELGEGIINPMQMYLGDMYNVMVNIAGLPSLALPCGKDKSGLPLGVQLIGRAFDEKTILGAGCAFEEVQS